MNSWIRPVSADSRNKVEGRNTSDSSGGPQGLGPEPPEAWPRVGVRVRWVGLKPLLCLIDLYVLFNEGCLQFSLHLHHLTVVISN